MKYELDVVPEGERGKRVIVTTCMSSFTNKDFRVEEYLDALWEDGHGIIDPNDPSLDELKEWGLASPLLGASNELQAWDLYATLFSTCSISLGEVTVILER